MQSFSICTGAASLDPPHINFLIFPPNPRINYCQPFVSTIVVSMFARQAHVVRLTAIPRRRWESSSRPTAASHSKAQPTLKERLCEHWNSGSILIYSSWILLLPFGFEYFLSSRSNREERGLAEEFQRMNTDMVGLWNEEKRQLLKAKPLFECVIRMESKLDGYKLFQGAIGDVVEVLKEETGPGSLYNMVRGTGAKSSLVGWYATKYLEKIERKKKGWLW